MAKAKKLPSGQWRTLVYSHTDTSGKRRYESFTADTKKESEYLAAKFALDKKARAKGRVKFKDARQNYIKSKNNILSPSTLRGYKQMNTYFSELDNLLVNNIDQQKLQNWVNNFTTTHAPKTVKNAYGFAKTVIESVRSDFNVKVTLPKIPKKKYYTPPDSDIVSVVKDLTKTDHEMLKAVCLAAFGTLRRSEICGLDASDINGNMVHVTNVLVKDADNNYVLNDLTKTEESDRYVELPEFVIDMLPKQGKIVSLGPDIITKRSKTILERMGLKHFRFHDLRHYSASIMHAIGIPDQYIMERGGWSDDRILKDVYRGVMEDYQEKFTDVTNKHFDELCNMKSNTKK